ncbi:MAG: molybdopterin converting factor subunit 1 [Bradymonadales bacterium]|nr:molybdopterin converting factor subunit 1 [Bradymonadales bacterium]
MSINITIRYFALVRQEVGQDQEVLSIAEGTTVAQLFDLLASLHPSLSGLRDRLRAAVNLKFVPSNHLLADGDEVALIPPVAGGGGRARLTTDPLDPLDLMEQVRADRQGALVSFVGTVRNTHQNRPVSALEYEAYPEMALAKLEEIAAEIDERLPECYVRVDHRIGWLEVGAISVVIAVSAPHRQEAFEACRHMIDRIKQDVPIWKREVGPDGEWWV